MGQNEAIAPIKLIKIETKIMISKINKINNEELL